MINESEIKKRCFYQDWDGIKNNCESIEGLSKLDKKKAMRSIDGLKRMLGDDFPQYAIDHHHPLFGNVVNQAPWTRIWLTEFYESLEKVKTQGNFESLLTRLKDADKYLEALSILKSSRKLIDAGFSVEYDPDITHLGSKKVPDYKIMNNLNEEIAYVEVSMQSSSRVTREAYTTQWAITQQIFHSHILMSGIIYKALSPKHLDEVSQKVKQTVDKAKLNQSFETLRIPGVINVAFAPDSERELIEAWAEENEMKVNSLTGPNVGVDEILRLKRKIEREQKQLPNGMANIVIIQNNWSTYYRDVEGVINELEEEVYNFPHLLGVIITQESMGDFNTPAFSKTVGQHTFISKPNAKTLSREEHIILLNKYCDHKVSPSTISQVISAYVIY